MLTILGLLAGVAPSASGAVAGDRVTGWGWNVFQQTSVPSSLTGKTVTAIAAGGFHNLALTSDGHITAWGYDGYGQTDIPAALATQTVTAIAAGLYHSVALTSDGHVTVWGDDHFGQPSVPASLDGKTVTAIAAGNHNSLALTSDGHVTAWGYNGHGQNTIPDSLDGQTITAIAEGAYHSLALTSDGHLTGWGNNGYGQADPPASLDDQTVTAFDGGEAHTVALTAEGHIVSWGGNYAGQTDIPAALAAQTVTAIAAGSDYSLALTADGHITGWGSNGYGQAAPPASLADQTVTAISGGIYHSLALSTTDANAAPTADDLTVTAGYQSATPVTLTGSDADDNDLTFTVASQPDHGILSGTGAQLIYTPAGGYTGGDSFTYTANDGTADSTPATVTITVSPEPNQAPTADDLTVAASYQTGTQVTLTGSDADDNDLTFTVASQPDHGILSGTGAQLIYTPASGYTGADSFTYTANDGTADSTPATVTITVSPEPNQAPTADNLTVAAGHQSATPVTLTGSDPNGDNLTFTVASPPAHGILSGTGAQLIYTPANGYTGADSFTYTANDGTTDSTPATVTITVSPGPPCVASSTPEKEFSVDADRSESAGSIRSGKVRTKKADELLVAFLAVHGSTTSSQSATKISGGGLTWTLAQRENASAGSSEVWYAYAPSELSSFRVKATFAHSSSSASITVAGFTHAQTATGASAHAGGSASKPRVTLTPQASGSVVWGVGRVIGSRYDPKPVTGQTESHDHTNKSPKTGYWVQRIKTPTTAGITVTLDETAATSKPWGYAAVEIPGHCG